jgi:hypothetical protein
MSRNVLLPGLVIFSLWTAFWWPVVCGDAFLYIRDISLFAVPMKHYMLERFASAELPLWTPYVSGGMPFLADPSNQVLYPPNVSFFLFDSVERALSMWVALHSLLGMFAFAGLCRVFGMSEWISAWAGINYGLAGYIVSITDNVNFLPAIAWVPMAIAFYQHGLATRGFQFSALSALCLSCVVLAGDAQDAVFLSALLMLLSIVALRADCTVHQCKSAAEYFPGAHLAATIGLAILVTAAQVLPTLDLIPESARHSTLDYGQISIWSFPVARVLEFFQPYIFGSHYPTFDFLVPEFYPRKTGPWAASVYLGTIPVLLVLVALGRMDRLRLLWLVVLIVGLFLSFGANTPVHRLVVDHIPFVGTQRYPEKFIFWVTLSACLLAGFGAQNLLDQRRVGSMAHSRLNAVTKFTLGIALMAILCWLSAYLPARAWFWSVAFFELNLWKVRIPFPIQHLNVLLIHTVVMLSIVGVWFMVSPARRGFLLTVMLMVSCLDLFWVHYRTVPTVPVDLLSRAPAPFALRSAPAPTGEQPYRVFFDTQSPGPVIAYQHNGPIDSLLRAGAEDEKNLIQHGYPHLYGLLYRRDRLHPNGGILHGVQYLNGPLTPLQLTANTAFESYLPGRDAHKAMTMANVRYVVTGLQPANPVWDDHRFVNLETDAVRNLRILENPDWLPRVLLVPNAIATSNDLQSINDALASIDDPRSHLTVVAQAPAGPDEAPVDVQLSVERPSPERIEVSGSSPYRQAYLLLNESYLDNWHAALNGLQVEVLRANLRFMAIAIGPGPFEVSFDYRPEGFLLGASLSVFGLLICVVLTLRAVFARRGPKRGAIQSVDSASPG